MPFLVWDSPRGRVVFEITRSLSVLGRDAGCDIAVEETSVSRRHALVELEEGGVRLTDLGSKGGTRINGAGLTPDLPSTLEAGDFINIGRVTLTYHVTPPPQAAPRPPAQPKRERSTPPPVQAPMPAASASQTWKYVALGLAFVLVAAIGALVALQLNARQPVQVVQLPGFEPEPEPAPEPEPEPEPEPAPAAPPTAVDTGPSAAPAGMLPPQAHAAIDLCPDLIELEGNRFFPIRLRDWDRKNVNALGSDGRLYRIDFAAVVKIMDRADLERRAAEMRSRLADGDIDARLDLAQWCAQRFIYSEARVLANEVMGMDPMRTEAKAILTAVGDA